MNRRPLVLIGSAALLGAGLLLDTGCPDRPLAAPVPIVTSITDTVLNADLKDKVDVLFVIDNSPSMSPKQEALASNFKSFISILDASGADYHVGIATSNVGAQPPPGDGTLSGPLGGYPPEGCDTVDGDDGALQAVPCTSRAPSSTYYSTPAVQGICNTICPTPITPVSRMVGGDMATSNFIASNGGTGAGLVTNVPGDDVAGAFACMAFVGDTGCGIEMQLEGMKRALDGTNPVTNQDFLRPDALLAIVFITDEDDCSSNGKNRLNNDPLYMDCSPGGSFDPNPACFNPDYRCYAVGTTCNEPLDKTGVKTGCHESTMSDNFLEPISYYTDFLDKQKPGQVIVDAIDTPPDGPVQIDQSDGPYTYGLNRSTANPGAACVGPVDPVTGLQIVGKPQVRLHDFIAHYKGNEYSVCDITGYDKALQEVATHIVKNLPKNCLPPLPSFGADGGAAGTPATQCSVLQTPANGAPTVVAECSTACCDALAADPQGLMSDPPVAAACAAEKATPCWCAVRNPVACREPADPTLVGVYGGTTGTDSFACQETSAQ